jgi:hypothetical protein
VKKVVALSALPLVLLFAVAFQSPDSGPRMFYLTQTAVPGDQALTACAVGYHMASLWEIHEPSNLRYNTRLGVTQDDSGFGPPTGMEGWMRTGSVNNVQNQPGLANCNSWTSHDLAHSASY